MIASMRQLVSPIYQDLHHINKRQKPRRSWSVIFTITMSLSLSTLFRSSPWWKGATKGGQDCQDHRHPGLPNSVHSEQSSCHKNYHCSKNVQLFRCVKTRRRWCTSSSTRFHSALSLMTMGPSNHQIIKITLMARCQIWCTIELHRDPISKVLSEW